MFLSMFDSSTLAAMKSLSSNEKTSVNSVTSAASSYIMRVYDFSGYSEDQIQKEICCLMEAINYNRENISKILEFVLSIISLYSTERLGSDGYIKNPAAFAVAKDLEDYIIKNISCVLKLPNYNLTINTQKVNKYNVFINKFKKLCKKVKIQ